MTGLGFPFWPTSSADVFNYFGVATFCIDVCTAIFPLEESMAQRSDILLALLVCLVFVWGTYACFGDLAAAMYSNQDTPLAGNILLSIPSDSLVGNLVQTALALVMKYVSI